jgi:DNA polymerase
VENITQGLTRIPLFDQMLEINRYVVQDGGRVVLNVHDEIIAIVPEDRAEEDFAKMIAIMKIPPVWCHDLPLDAEGGTAKNYSK